MKEKKENYTGMLKRWFEHAQLRSMERYGIVYTNLLQFIIRQDIENHVFNLLLEIPNSTRVVYRGRLLDKVVTFIFCGHHKVVVTFLHNSWVVTDSEEFEVLNYRDRKRKRKEGKGKKKLIKKGINLKVGFKSTRKMKSPRLKNYEEENYEEDDYTT